MFVPEVYQVGNRWEYAILENGRAIIRQDFHPDKPGQEPMTKAEAESLAAVVLARLSEPVVPSNVELNKTDFLRLFTNEELGTLIEAAKVSPAVAVYQYKLSQADVVRLDDPDIVIGLPTLEASGLLGAGRAAQILRNESP